MVSFLANISEESYNSMLLQAFLVIVSIQLVYASSRAVNLFRSVLSTRCFTNDPESEKAGKIPSGEEPAVTIQICTYNEGKVVEETIKTACSVDWPKSKLYVQVLDDSTELQSQRIIENTVMRLRMELGVHVVHLTRPDREGYKGGNLRYHFETNLQTDYVAQFDADHHIEPDFLRRAMPFFYSRSGHEKKNIGLVQTPWAYYNIHQNMLTEADALGLDIHHVIEQQGRGAFLKVFGFNGTGGIWRRSAIKNAGGWSWQTLTEDLALSYDAFCAGYEFVYVRSCPQRLECPSGILAHIQQKHRWTKGFLQVLRLKYMQLFRSPRAGLFVKVEAFFHMTGSTQYFWLLVLVVLHPLITYHGLDSDFIRALTVAPTLVPLLEAIVTVFAKVSSSMDEYNTVVDRMTRLLFVLPYFSLKNGMALFELKAVIEGLTNDDATFLATPKEGSSHTTDSHCEKNLSIGHQDKQELANKFKSANKAHSSQINVAIALTGIVIAVYRLWYFLTFDLSAKVPTLVHLWFHIMNVCVCLGYFCVGCGYLYATAMEWRGSTSEASIHMNSPKDLVMSTEKGLIGRGKPRPWKPLRPRTRKGALSMTQRNMLCISSLILVYSSLLLQHNASLIHLRNTISSPFRPDFSCPVSFPVGARTQKMFVVFGEPRTGSNAMFEMIAKLGEVANYKDLEIISLYELFLTNHSKSQAYRIAAVEKRMATVCDTPGMTEYLKNEFSSLDALMDIDGDPHSYMNMMEELSTEEWQRDVVDFFRRHPNDSNKLLQYLQGIPSWSRNPYIAFKVFDFHLSRHLSTTPKEFVQSLTQIIGHENLKIALLWRRRLIEGFVSSELALQSGQWAAIDKGKNVEASPTKITVKRDKLERYITKQRRYYSRVISALQDAGIQFEVFEYERDLSDPSRQLATLKGLISILDVPEQKIDVEQVLSADLKFSKQTNTSVEMYVENWQEVLNWGYGGNSEDWPDFFEAHPLLRNDTETGDIR